MNYLLILLQELIYNLSHLVISNGIAFLCFPFSLLLHALDILRRQVGYGLCSLVGLLVSVEQCGILSRRKVLALLLIDPALPSIVPLEGLGSLGHIPERGFSACFSTFFSGVHH